jgi:hypothetical protein
MKVRRFLLAIVALMAFSFTGFSQVEQVDAPMFGTTRSLNAAYSHDFAEVSGKAVSYQFKIVNDGKSNMQITDIEIPEKVGVTMLSKNIPAGKEGIIVVTVDPTVATVGDFKEKIVVKTVQNEISVVTTKEITFTISGKVK